MEQDEIYLIDLWRTLLREWKWFVALLVLVLAVTFAFIHTAKRQWEATAWIQIGQVGLAPPGQDPKVEPLARVLERLQLVPFQNDVMKRMGYSPDTPEARLFRKSLKLEPLPYAGPLIKLSVRGLTPQQAQQFAQATVEQLRAVHQGVEAAPLKLAHKRLDEVQSDLQNAMSSRDQLQQSTGKGAGADTALIESALARKDEEIHKLQETRSDLAARLSANYTYETSLMWPIYVPDHQAFPNPVLMWGIGLLVGLLLGAFAAVARNAARRGGSRP
ncbi:Wzz/FepE/Etk N-terminal domain-containing protein [Dyella sp. 2HG41-7]|uniref:Wzz/FepE/Etk N-terminal domain-containing protein n=1 Tax=Dyella sp. 2HG41-7 TaxID=2883239 RepID=UPI001F3E8D3C|nr:Wzz/FepE/Etk N-terminal domain-containing protein [Dyella sp. 2HG41-7]